jgi:hypothetical protein
MTERQRIVMAEPDDFVHCQVVLADGPVEGWFRGDELIAYAQGLISVDELWRGASVDPPANYVQINGHLARPKEDQ